MAELELDRYRMRVLSESAAPPMTKGCPPFAAVTSEGVDGRHYPTVVNSRRCSIWRSDRGYADPHMALYDAACQAERMLLRHKRTGEHGGWLVDEVDVQP